MRDINDQTERNIAVHRDVFALGLAIYPSAHLKGVCRTTLQELEGDDYATVPFSLAKSVFDTMEVSIRSKLSYLGGVKLIEFDRGKGVVQMTAFGATVIKKLQARIRAQL